MSASENENLSAKPDETISKRQIEIARYKQQLLAIERQGRLAAWNDYIGFGVSKILGFVGLIIGVLESLDPSCLTITLKNPEMIAGVGLALLTGKSILTLIAKMEKSRGGQG